MQTLSIMRRNSTSKKHIIPLGTILFLILYQILTSLYVYLTPLVGLFFCYLIFNKEEERKTRIDLAFPRYMVFLYLIFADLSKGFYLFSSVIFFYIFYNLFVEWLQTSFKCKNCVIVAYVVSGYLGIFGLNNLLAYILNENFFTFGWEYGLYIFSDVLLAIIVFRDKII